MVHCLFFVSSLETIGGRIVSGICLKAGLILNDAFISIYAHAVYYSLIVDLPVAASC